MMLFLWIKALHIVAVIAWMAGLFYLPRLYVYHVRSAVGSETDQLFKVMEGRLVRVIMRPACVVALLAGSALVYFGQFDLGAFWLVLKLLGVVALLCYHGLLEHYLKLFARGWRGRPERYFRMINEVPTILLIWIVVLVVVKPFT
jgi:protoporphyrinogen IX oxidase